MVREAGLFIAPTLSLERRGRAVHIGLSIKRFIAGADENVTTGAGCGLDSQLTHQLTGTTKTGLAITPELVPFFEVVGTFCCFPESEAGEFQGETDANEIQSNVSAR